MASSSNLVHVFFFILLAILQAHARDNYVFSKVSRDRDDTTLPSSNNNNNNNNENEVAPTFEQQQLDDEQPSFIPQTTHSNYGLYGRETTPQTTQLMDNNFENSNNNLNNNEKYENVEYSNDENKYVPQLSESSYTNDVGPTKYPYVANNNHFDKNDNDINGEGKYYENREYHNGRKNVYDVDGETKFDAYMKNMELSYSKNNYNNNNFNSNGKLYGDRENNQEENYGNNYFHGNGINEGYKNRFPEEGEFDFDDQP